MSLPKLLLATNNKGKLEELRVLLAGVPFELVSPRDIGLTLEVAETGHTYAANARLKARAFAKASGLLTLADDSGLEVDALGGAPGVLSSRYAGPGVTDSQRVAFLLAKLKDVPMEERRARFRCVIVIASPDGKYRQCSGSCRGEIALKSKGNNGFGYDPIFCFSKLCKTMAELPPKTKNRISHRARAAARARTILLSL
jgi:XTP/dITP diphosphohydrolase